MHEKHPIKSFQVTGEVVSWTMLHIKSNAEAPAGFAVQPGYYSIGKNSAGDAVILRKLGSDNIQESQALCSENDEVVQKFFDILHPPQVQKPQT